MQFQLNVALLNFMSESYMHSRHVNRIQTHYFYQPSISRVLQLLGLPHKCTPQQHIDRPTFLTTVPVPMPSEATTLFGHPATDGGKRGPAGRGSWSWSQSLETNLTYRPRQNPINSARAAHAIRCASSSQRLPPSRTSGKAAARKLNAGS